MIWSESVGSFKPEMGELSLDIVFYISRNSEVAINQIRI